MHFIEFLISKGYIPQWLSNLENKKLLLTNVINCNPYNKHIDFVKYELENVLQSEQELNNNLENN